MAIPRRDIQNKIRAIMLADSEYNDLVVVMVGFLFSVPDDWFPNATIIMPDEEDAEQRTGLVIREYVGQIRFDVRVQNTPVVSGRSVDVPSYLQVEDYVSHAVQLFNLATNRKLQNLTGSNWAVRDFKITGGVSYGIDSRTQENDYENFGIVGFRVETQEERS